MSETDTKKLMETLKVKGFRTLSDWCLYLGHPYSGYLEYIFGYGDTWFSKALYSPFEILEAIVSYEGGLGNAHAILNLVNRIYGTNLQ